MFDRRRPDPALGVFETLLVLDGSPVELDAHLARLDASLTALYPDRDPPAPELPALGPPRGASTPGAATEVLRISVAPDADRGLAARIERREAPGAFLPDSGSKSSGEAISLRCLHLPGGLGPHKWTDRSLLEEAQRDLAGDALPLILDEDESVLEASRANVFAVRDGALLTPPADGRILPGVTRMRVLEVAGALGIETSETALSRDDLLAADEAFLSGSVRGIERVRDLDGAALGNRGDVTERIAGALRQTWLDAEFG